MFRHCQQTAQLLSQALHSNAGSSRQLGAAIGSYNSVYGRVIGSTAATATPQTVSSDASLISAAARHFSSSTRKADVVIVGAGHNGLVAALLLAKQGLKVSTVSTLPPLCLFSFHSNASVHQHRNIKAVYFITMQQDRARADRHRHTTKAAAWSSPFQHSMTFASHKYLLQPMNEVSFEHPPE